MITVIIITFLFAIASSLYSSYQKNLELLKEQSLETNRVYAQKLAQIVDVYLKDALIALEYSAKEIADDTDNEAKLLSEVNRIYEQERIFNSVTIANPEGVIVTGAPKNLNLKGTQIKSKEGLKAIKNQKPFISKPYTAATGRLLISLSYPIFSKEGDYKGLVTGTIYLHESNFFYTALGKHYYSNGSYVYVVDGKGHIIYHQDSKRIGDDGSANPVVQRLMKGESGSQAVTNTLGINMLAGFSAVKLANWGIVSQTPEAVAIESVGNLVMDTFFTELPFIVLAVIIAILATSKITKPLQNIARIAEYSVEESEMTKLTNLKAWYYEARQIKVALIHSFSFLHSQVNLLTDQSTIDPLTNLMNRRVMDDILEKWVSTNKHFSAIMIDLDHFKDINDTYGHTVGDEVLIFFARQMRQVIREQDVCCRFGGEEFIILLPEANIDDAFKVAERLRQSLEKTESPCGQPITISAGIAAFPQQASTSTELLKVVDLALYEAKRTGRNHVVIAKD